MKITVVGLGYVGSAVSVLLARQHSVCAYDISSEKAALINQRKSPVHDVKMEKLLQDHTLQLTGTTDKRKAFQAADCIVLALPTDYVEDKKRLDTRIIEEVVSDAVIACPDAIIIIRSTIPIGFIAALQNAYPDTIFVYCPEFLREGNAMNDSLNPSRIVTGTDIDNPAAVKAAEKFAQMLIACTGQFTVPVIHLRHDEAESVKLAANSYLAMRVAFFNEYDTLAQKRNMNIRGMLDALGKDARIGSYYNNPGFGYGGYCLPKDIKQMKDLIGGSSGGLWEAVIESNENRKRFIVQQVCNRYEELRKHVQNPVVGIYRLTMKKETDSLRYSAVLDIIQMLQEQQIPLLIYEPLISKTQKEGALFPDFKGISIEPDLETFKKCCHLIVANRYDGCLDDVQEKVYTRDVYRRD